MLISGCDKNDISSAKYKSIATSHAAEVINALIAANVQYAAKYDDKKLVLTYSSDDTDVVSELLDKLTSDNADYIERLRSEGGSQEEYAALLSEVAEIMGISASSLQNRPLELRLYLVQAYIDNWFSNRTTIQKELERVTELGYYAQKEIAEAENMTIQTSSKTEYDETKHLDAVTIVEQEQMHFQQLEKEVKRTHFFTVEKLRQEARRIKKSAAEKPSHGQDLTETEETTMVRKK